METHIPRTAIRRGCGDWAKILARVDADALCGFGFEGEFVRPGAMVRDENLFLPGTDLAGAILLECAGNEGKSRGHNRAPYLYLLWRYDRASASWTELARSAAVDWSWALDLRPIAIRALQGLHPLAAPDAEAVAARILWLLEGELGPLHGMDLAIALDLVHGQLAARIVAADGFRKPARLFLERGEKSFE